MRKIIPIHFTKEGLENLKHEYEALLGTRPEAVRNLTEARNMGDLSENGLYKGARMRLSSIDATLRRLKNIIKLADIIEPSKKGIVSIGTSVTVFDGNNNKVFHIVGTYESEPKSGKISQNSPIGRALVGKKIDDVVEVDTPSGKNILTIISIL